ncbi:MAG: hypothetical protein HKO90_10810 [Flavobacteriaceae bacterium]|nr:hypothetical protein [Flavobacteriaceae bacterium]
MKKLVYILAALLLAGGTAFAASTTSDNVDHFNRFYRGYGNSFIFVEQGIEFAVFPDGQFDFNVNRYGPNFNAYTDFGGVSISFNSGYSYDAYVQYDNFGAVVQIENVPVYYDYYGRIIQAGNVRISYNSFGRIFRVGGLFVHYNRFNRFSHCSGFINVFNRHYVYRPWHRYYAMPPVNFCVLFNSPYRRYYNPVRHTYYGPYRNNFRPRSAVSYNRGRRGAVAQLSNHRTDRYRSDRVSRRGDVVANTSRADRNRPSRSDRADAIQGRPVESRGDRTDRNRPVSKTRPAVKPRSDRADKVKPRVNKPRTRPSVSNTTTQRGKPVVNRGKPSAKRDKMKRVSPRNERKTNSVTQRSKYSEKRSAQTARKRTASVSKNRSSNNKAKVSRSSSKKNRSTARRSRQ